MDAQADPRLYQIYDYWRGLRGNRRIPSRADFDPLDIPKLLPFVFLVEVLNDPWDFRFRLAGTHFDDFVGVGVTGHTIGEIFPPVFADELRLHWTDCVARGIPAICTGKLWVVERDYVGWEGVALPLSSDGITVDLLLGGAIFGLPKI